VLAEYCERLATVVNIAKTQVHLLGARTASGRYGKGQGSMPCL
jgi:hypothetical protein